MRDLADGIIYVSLTLASVVKRWWLCTVPYISLSFRSNAHSKRWDRYWSLVGKVKSSEFYGAWTDRTLAMAFLCGSRQRQPRFYVRCCLYAWPWVSSPKSSEWGSLMLLSRATIFHIVLSDIDGGDECWGLVRKLLAQLSLTPTPQPAAPSAEHV